MKKSAGKMSLIVLCAFILAAMATCAIAEDTYTVTVNGTVVSFPDQQPYVKNDRVMVPVRAPMEAMGVAVSWNNTEQSATMVKGDITAVFTVGSSSYTVNGEALTMDVAPEIVVDRVAFPIRYCAEAMGGTATYNDKTKTVAIVTNDVPLTGKVIDTTVADSGKSIDMMAGDVLTITLDSNSSTGFLWAFKANPDESCIQVKETYIDPPTDAVGTAGQQKWTITAAKPGTVGIEIGYARPWEHATLENTFTLTLNITAAPEAVEYTIGDSGKIATLKMGEEMTLALESNPSTGFFWAFTQSPDANILTYSDVQFEPAPASPGSPGTDRWLFTPVAPGTTTFELAYAQPGSTATPDKFMSMTVIVTE